MSETIIVRRTGQAPLRIRGEVVAEVESSSNNAHPDYSGSAGHWSKVTVYKTAKGLYVVALHCFTCWEGEHDSDEVWVLLSLSEVVMRMSDRLPGWMLQELIGLLGEEAVAEEVR